MTEVRQRRCVLLPGLILVTWIIACIAGLRSLGAVWSEELSVQAGIFLVLAGLVLCRMTPDRAPTMGRWVSAPELWLACSGTALVAGWWTVALALGVVGVGLGIAAGQRWPTRASVAAACRELWRLDGALLLGVSILLVLMAASKDAMSPGGPKAHRMELGIYGVALAVLGVVWAGKADGARALSLQTVRTLRARALTPRRLVALALVPFCGFVALACLVRLPQVEAMDNSFIHLVYHGGDRTLRNAMRLISNAGGEDLALIWIPFIALGLAVFRRARSLRFFLTANFGVFGIETIFKTLSFRSRPDLTRGAHFDSFPSGHTLSAVILAGTLLLILWPSAKQRARWLLVAAAAAWPVVMGASRIYLGRHFLTDVLGSWLLGVAWVLGGAAILLAVDRASATEPARE
jgi:membrane-associated phospholipid phosphatase